MRIMETHRILFRIIVVVLFLFLFLPVGCTYVGLRSVAAQSAYPQIMSYRVEGAPNYNSPGNESFWRGISWTSIPLAASVAPGGGHTSNVRVKSGNDGFNIYVLLQWSDPEGPSFGTSGETYRAPNGMLLPLNPENTSDVSQLFYNSTYYYPDRTAVLWFIGNSADQQQSPKMELDSNGAITGGAANIWHWQSTPTDNSPNDTSFPGGYTDPMGNAIYPADNISFAEDDYTNTTGFFVTAASFGAGAPNLNPFADPYIIHVGNYFSNVNKTWTVEMVRTFTTSDAGQYRIQLATGSSYFVAFAVWNGKLGESAHVKSVSQWYSLTISDLPASSPSPQVAETGVSPTLAAVVGFGLLIVGVIIGIVARPKIRQR